MVLRGLLTIQTYSLCVDYFQTLNTVIKKKAKTNANLFYQCNAIFVCLPIHKCSTLFQELLNSLHSPHGKYAWVWPHGRSWHQRKNFIMNWHRATLRCLARNKRYFKTLELSTEHLTTSLEAEYEVVPQQAVYFSIGFFLPWLYSS